MQSTLHSINSGTSLKYVVYTDSLCLAKLKKITLQKRLNVNNANRVNLKVLGHTCILTVLSCIKQNCNVKYHSVKLSPINLSIVSHDVIIYF